jgi:CheY-like chemotaxis protein
MKRILFVDDNQPFRISFSRILEKSGYEVEQAEDGRIGLRKFRENPPDLVICDLIMPDVEGLETMRGIHEMDKGMKILAISGGGRVNALDYLKVAQMMGAVVTLAKPFTSEELIGAVEKLIGPPAESESSA